MTRRVFVIGNGMTKFERPGTRPNWHTADMGQEALTAALKECSIEYMHIEAAVVSYCYGDPTCGQEALHCLGDNGIPIFNVNNNCASGSSAIYLARTLIESGRFDCVVALGFEKMERGLTARYGDRPSPVARHYEHIRKVDKSPLQLDPRRYNDMTAGVLQMFDASAKEYIQKYLDNDAHRMRTLCAKITTKNRRHGTANPFAMLQTAVSEQDLIAEKYRLSDSMYVSMSAPTADGGAAAILVSEKWLLKHSTNKSIKPIEIISQIQLSDNRQVFQTSAMALAGLGIAREASRQLFEQAKSRGISINDVRVVELHDCFASNEVMLYEALGLCGAGKAEEMISKSTSVPSDGGLMLQQLPGSVTVNPSGGLESKGHPIGATGLGQCAELCWQLRGCAKGRQVPGRPRVALQHNYGLGSACVLTLYKALENAKL